ncbi:hypothetical protein [Kitasatospora phosalacinea]|uniref:hypothetical protein n=1 Tax=Kitasatospora phosalacinea TaxID=2065 RepID=UPI000525E7AB|nr:hypothetical protein [Kitasatospora phosalacinea]
MDTAHPLFGTPTGHPGPDGPPKCSAKGCRDLAAWSLLWNNPKLHTPDRRKTWLACDTHRDSLSQFLAVRGFLKETEPFDRGEPSPE